eukprot:scaffold244410_cov15-Tisochrysis_lutea.AAC.1
MEQGCMLRGLRRHSRSFVNVGLCRNAEAPRQFKADGARPCAARLMQVPQDLCKCGPVQKRRGAASIQKADGAGLCAARLGRTLAKDPCIDLLSNNPRALGLKKVGLCKNEESTATKFSSSRAMCCAACAHPPSIADSKAKYEGRQFGPKHTAKRHGQ